MANELQQAMWAPGINRSQRIAEGLAGYWPFWEGTARTVMDVQNGNTGLLVNMDPSTDWVVAPTGSAMAFAQAGSQSVNVSALTLTQLTLTAWIYPTSAENNWVLPIGDQNDSFWGRNFSTDQFRIRLDGTSVTASATLAIATNTWEHWATTYDGVDARFYVNGVELGAPVANPGRTFIASTIGGQGWTAAYESTHRISLVSIHNRALRPSDIAHLYGEGEHAITQRPKHRPAPVLSTAPPAAIHNLLQGSNLGADLYNGSLL